MKKYKSSEAIAMLEQNPKLKLVCGSSPKHELYVDGGYLQYDSYTLSGTPISKDLPGAWFSDNIKIQDKWELLQQPIPFMEAVKAYSEGKTIYCMVGSEPKTKYTYNPNMGSCFKPMKALENNEAIGALEMLKGIWYVEDSNE
jgi:hypothetical protein